MSWNEKQGFEGLAPRLRIALPPLGEESTCARSESHPRGLDCSRKRAWLEKMLETVVVIIESTVLVLQNVKCVIQAQ